MSTLAGSTQDEDRIKVKNLIAKAVKYTLRGKVTSEQALAVADVILAQCKAGGFEIQLNK